MMVWRVRLCYIISKINFTLFALTFRSFQHHPPRLTTAFYHIKTFSAEYNIKVAEVDLLFVALQFSEKPKNIKVWNVPKISHQSIASKNDVKIFFKRILHIFNLSHNFPHELNFSNPQNYFSLILLGSLMATRLERTK